MIALPRKLRAGALVALVASLLASPAAAYIGPGAGIAAAGSVLVLLGFHLVSVFALPWLLWLARLRAQRPPRTHLLVPVAFGLLGLAVIGKLGKFSELASFGRWTIVAPMSRPPLLPPTMPTRVWEQ